MGGSGELSQMTKGYPYAAHAQQLKEYMLMLAGYAVSELYILFTANHNSSCFVEYAFHHLVTIALFMSSYMLNLWEVGALIALIHDSSEILVSLLKTLSETHFDKSAFTALVFVMTIAVWTYARLFVFGQVLAEFWNSATASNPLWTS